MLISALFFNVWPSHELKRGVFLSSGNSVPTVSSSTQDAAELLRLRQENARLESEVGYLKTSSDATNRERLELVDRVGAISAERARFEEQAKKLSLELAEARRAVASSTTTGMGRRSSSASTASPPSSPMQDVVLKSEFEAAQALAQRMQKVASDVESRLKQAQEKIVELEAQLPLPDVRVQRKEWHGKIVELQQLIQVLKSLKPPLVPKLGLSLIPRHESTMADPENKLFNRSFNGSFGQVRKGSVLQRQSNSPYQRRASMVGVAGTSPLQEAHVTSGNGSPQDHSLSLFPIVDVATERHSQGEGPAEWAKALRALEAYLAARIREAESSDDDLRGNTAASASAQQKQPMPETAAVAQLREEMHALATGKSQVEISLDAAQKELKRMREICIKFSREIGLDENYLPNVRSASENSLVKILAQLGLDVHRVNSGDGGLGVGTRRLLAHLNGQLSQLGGEALIAQNGTLNIVPKREKSKGGCCS